MKLISIYVTYPDNDSADSLTLSLLENKLVACGNRFSSESQYPWGGEIQKENETIVVYKSRSENWESIRSHIEENHPYDVPCIVKYEIEVNTSYGEWVMDSTQSSGIHSKS